MNIYLKEIKNRAILILFSFVFAFLMCYNYKETALFLLVKSCVTSSSLKTFYMISTNLTDIFSIYIKISIFISLQISIFFSLYQIIVFLTPGLYTFELDRLVRLSLMCFAFFFLSLVLLNCCILPFSWSFFSSFQSTSTQTIEIFFEANIVEYFNFYTQTYISSIIFGQLFVLVFLILDSFSSKLKLIKNYRKLVYILFVIISTSITPPDVISQVMLSSIFISLYEFLIVIIIIKSHYSSSVAS